MTFSHSVLFGSPDISEIVVHSIGHSNQFSLSKIVNAFHNSQKESQLAQIYTSEWRIVSTLSHKSVNTFEHDANTNIQTVGSRTLSKSLEFQTIESCLVHAAWFHLALWTAMAVLWLQYVIRTALIATLRVQLITSFQPPLHNR